MERVVFVVESNKRHIPCLLNPESLLLQRRAGVETRQFNGGLIANNNLKDDPLVFTGGGFTELTVNLLFDVNVSGTKVKYRDIRRLTDPLWDLSENSSRGRNHKRPALVRLIWGKAFSFHGVITDVAERLEYFTAQGIPQRSFLRVRMRRTAEENEEKLTSGAKVPPSRPTDLNRKPPVFGEETAVHSVRGSMSSPKGTGGSGGTTGDTERLDQLAYQHYGDASQWRLLAWVNDVSDPAKLSAGKALKVPEQGDKFR